MQVALLDPASAERSALLQQFLRTPWTVTPVENPGDDDALRTALADASAIITSSLTPEQTSWARRLQLVHCVGAGHDRIDTTAFPPGCTLCNVYEHEGPIAEYVMLCTLMLATRIEAAQRRFREGLWPDSGRFDGVFHDEVAGWTMGLLGYGHIGRKVTRRAKAFGMKVQAVARTRPADPDLDAALTLDDLDTMLGEVDVLVIACPLTDRTRGLLSADRLARLKPTALLINPARAEIIDETALFTALRERRIAGAALDVWYQYPENKDVCMHGSGLPFHELDNVIITPHFSAWTREMVERRYARIAANLDHLARGEPLERVVFTAGPG